MWCPQIHITCAFFNQGREGGHTELESLQQENEALKAQLARLTTQLLEVSAIFLQFLEF